MSKQHEYPMNTPERWFTEFIEGLEESPRRRRQLERERVVVPAKDQAARDAEQRTEHERRIIAHERERERAANKQPRYAA